MNFVVGNRGSVVESDFCTKHNKFDVPKAKSNRLFANHVTQVCEAHDQVILSFPEQVKGFARVNIELRENIEHDVHI